MSQWESLHIPEFPEAITDVMDTTSDSLQALQEALNVLRPPVETLLTFITGNANPALLAMQLVIGESRKFLKEFGDASVFWLTLHPWTGNLGTVGDINPYLLELSSNALLTYLQSSLYDLGDVNRPTGNGVMVVLAAGATHPTGFISVLQTLGTLFNLQEFVTLSNRIKALESFNNSSASVPSTPPSSLPDWQNAGRLHSLIPALGNFITQADSVLASLQTDSSLAVKALQEIEKTLNKKLAQITTAQQALNRLREALNQNWADIHILINEGQLQNSIVSDGFPMHYKYTCAVALAGSKPDLEPLMKLLGK